VEQATLVSVTADYNKVRNMDIVDGRYFTFGESQRGAQVAIIGADIADQLFPRSPSAVGKTFKVLGRTLTVIGVMRKEGEDLLGWTADNQVLVPYNFTKTVVDVKSNRMEPLLAIKAKDGVSNEDLKQEIRGIMRAQRSLRPTQDDNFAINELSLITGVLNTIFGVIGFAGLVIGSFSILVGGFGIANIMFVSVKERTNIIGIKKALGAKSVFILIEFLVEAVVLCLLGGVIGLLAVLLETYVLGVLMKEYYTMDFEFVLTFHNVAVGLTFSIVTGIIAGFVPAYVASKMKPVDAIRSK
jgi:putative ABC transport system permease protein